MRGTHEDVVISGVTYRFIPAHAGNTPAATWKYAIRSVHPRACGEHPSGCPFIERLNGSSPRMRGTPDGFREFAVLRRFIPAHAGNTPKKRETTDGVAVHPRACGEHSRTAIFSCSNAGSSPRMRGTHLYSLADESIGRFIPAHAGNTDLANSRIRPAPVHPRACGEHSISSTSTPGRCGSSPRMRGTPHRRVDHPAGGRFIPAHAGNTSKSFPAIMALTVHPRACGEHTSSTLMIL